MGRRKDDAGMDLSSFLNIMTATIGVQTLTLVIFALQIKPGVRLNYCLLRGEGYEWKLCDLQQRGELNMLIRNQRITMNINDERLDAMIKGLGTIKPRSTWLSGKTRGLPCFEN